MDGNGTGDICGTTVRNKRAFFWMRWLHRSGFFRKYGHLGLFEAKHTCVIHGLARYSFFCFRSERVDRCVGVEHDEEYLEAVDLTSCVGTIPSWLASYFLV